MAQDEKIDEQLKKHIDDVGRDVRQIFDPVYAWLCSLSKEIEKTAGGVDAVEFNFPTGSISWTRKVRGMKKSIVRDELEKIIQKVALTKSSIVDISTPEGDFRFYPKSYERKEN